MTLREARARTGRSQREVGMVAGLPQQTVSNYEMGHTVPNARVAQRLERILGCRPGEIDWDPQDMPGPRRRRGRGKPSDTD